MARKTIADWIETLRSRRAADAAPIGARALDRERRPYWLARASSAVIVMERVWPRLWLLASIVATFLAFSFFDLFRPLPPALHLTLLALFGLALAAAALWLILGLRPPSRTRALARLERDNGLERQPLLTLDEEPASSEPARSLALAHRRRLAEALPDLEPAQFRPDMAQRDPRALRIAPALGLAIAAAFAWDQWGPRLEAAFRPNFAIAAPTTPIASLWIDPPAYTGAPPIVAEGVAAALEANGALRAPEGSTALAQLRGSSADRSVVLRLGAEEWPLERLGDGSAQAEAVLAASGELSAYDPERDEVLARWPIEVAADDAPIARFANPPGVTLRAALRIEAFAADDYGVEHLRFVIRPVEGSIVEERKDLPARAGLAQLERVFHVDLTAHPAAGLEADLLLEAEDALGQLGWSDSVRVVLPERAFASPLARAIIGLRKRFARAPEEAPRIARQLRDLAPAAEPFGAGVQLGLFSGAAQVYRAENGVERRRASDTLWDLALLIEEGGLADAERRMRDLQERIAEAMAEGADPEEIERLMAELEQAMAEFMQELMRQAQQQQGQQPQDGQQPPEMAGDQRIEAQDLQELLDRARELMRAGRMDEAQELMAQLRETLENMRAQAGQGRPSPQAQALRDLQELMRRQQQLMDETFEMQRQGQQGSQGQQDQEGARESQQGQQGRQGGLPQLGGGPGQEGQGPHQGQGGGGGQGQSSPEQLAELQELLRRGLGELMRRLGEQGQDIPGALGQGEMRMRDAEGALRDGMPQQAGPAQSEALDALRQGGEQLAEQLAQQMRAAQGQGQPQPNGQRGEQNQRDPLGRSMRNEGGFATEGVDVPGASELGRARALLDELRRRLGARDLAPVERDYLERLLERF